MWVRECLVRLGQLGDMRNANKILVKKLVGKRPLGRPRSRWVDNIRVDLRETG
jgi:hypothetical protein